MSRSPFPAIIVALVLAGLPRVTAGQSLSLEGQTAGVITPFATVRDSAGFNPVSFQAVVPGEFGSTRAAIVTGDAGDVGEPFDGGFHAVHGKRLLVRARNMQGLTMPLPAMPLVVPGVLPAQDRAAVPPDALVQVRLAIERAATLRPLDDLSQRRHDFALAGSRPSVQRSSFRSGFAGRHPILVGALIGLGAGALVGAVKSCGRPPDRESYCWPATAGFGALGAGLGAIVGYTLAE